VNYYALVRPEIEFRASIQKLQQQSLASQQPAEAQNALAIPTTGHFAGFMTHNTYFQSLTGGAAGGSLVSPGGTGTGVRPPTAPTAPRTGR
jgi:hypothetical protein